MKTHDPETQSKRIKITSNTAGMIKSRNEIETHGNLIT